MMNLDIIKDKTLNGKGDSDKHLMLLYSLVIGSGAKIIIELGVRGGNTTIPLVMGAKETKGTVYSVDINPTNLKLDGDLREYNKFFLKDAIAFLNDWDTNIQIDLVLVDDWHAYAHTKKELDILEKIVSPKTVILLHDLMYENTCPSYHSNQHADGEWAEGAVYRSVAELDPQKWEWATLPWNHGMTILRKKSDAIITS